MRSSIIAKNGIFLDLETIEWHKKSYSRNRLFLKIQLSVSMSSSLSYSFGMELMQPDPLQLPHTMEHAIPCFLQEHLIVPQTVRQLHHMICMRSSGAGNKSVVTGTSIPSLSFHPHSSGKRSSPAPFHCCTWKYTQKTVKFSCS